MPDPVPIGWRRNAAQLADAVDKQARRSVLRIAEQAAFETRLRLVPILPTMGRQAVRIQLAKLNPLLRDFAERTTRQRDYLFWSFSSISGTTPWAISPRRRLAAALENQQPASGLATYRYRRRSEGTAALRADRFPRLCKARPTGNNDGGRISRGNS
jgi:hypothetical protein